MATAIELRFPFGRYHANPWGRHTNEGAVEWPPSPWRLARALLATWHERAPEIEPPRVREALEILTVPAVADLPRSGAGTTRHYMPYNKGAGESTSLALDSWVALDPTRPATLTWEIDLDADRASTMRVLLDRLAYLGRAESLVDARLVLGAEPDEGGERWIVDPGEEHRSGAPSMRVLVPDAPLDLDALSVRTGDLHSRGVLDPPGARWVRYVQIRPQPRSTSGVRRPARHFPVAFRYAVLGSRRPSIDQAILFADLCRAAVQGIYGRGDRERNHPALSGKDATGVLQTHHQHAHWLPVGDNRVDALVVWIPGADGGGPAGIDDEVVRALTALRRLNSGKGADLPFHLPVELGLEYVGDISGAVGWNRPTAGIFESVHPFLTDRHRKRHETMEVFIEDAVRRELASRPEYATADVDVEVLPRSWAGTRRYRRREHIHEARIGRHVRLTFAEEVPVPVSLGALCHFGAGLFLPVNA